MLQKQLDILWYLAPIKTDIAYCLCNTHVGILAFTFGKYCGPRFSLVKKGSKNTKSSNIHFWNIKPNWKQIVKIFLHLHRHIQAQPFVNWNPLSRRLIWFFHSGVHKKSNQNHMLLDKRSLQDWFYRGFCHTFIRMRNETSIHSTIQYLKKQLNSICL